MKYKLHKRVMFMAAITLIMEVWLSSGGGRIIYITAIPEPVDGITGK